MIERLAIVGVGLIGGSLGLALRRAGAVREIVGVGRSSENLELARARGIIDRYTSDPREGVRDADVVFIATPAQTVVGVAEAMYDALRRDAVVTDGASTKSHIAAALRARYGGEGPAFVPGHPIAGTEKSGAGAAFAELFDGRRTILTPEEQTPPAAVERVRAMWTAAGAEVEIMSPQRHDAVFAAVSHLPHAVAFALVETVSRLQHDAGLPILRYAAGGFKDFTRIASSDPVMWRDIALDNRDELLRALHAYARQLADLTALVEAGDAAGLEAYFARAKATRDGVVNPERT